MKITRRLVDSSRRTAAIGGAVVAAALFVMFVVEVTGIWRPVGMSILWLAALVPALIWVVFFATTLRYELVIDDTGIARNRGKHHAHVRWDKIQELVELGTKQRHLVVLSPELPADRSPGENSLIRAFRLPGNGLVFRADDEVRAAVTERLGPPRTVRDVVGL